MLYNVNNFIVIDIFICVIIIFSKRRECYVKCNIKGTKNSQ